jgi:hypothetical protein
MPPTTHSPTWILTLSAIALAAGAVAVVIVALLALDVA